jgi:hypothetical protein
MATGSIEHLPSGSFRAVVRAGKDPITGKPIKLTETCGTEDAARSARDRMLVLVEAENHPARSATLAVLMKAWMDVADHELTTRSTTASKSADSSTRRWGTGCCGSCSTGSTSLTGSTSTSAAVVRSATAALLSSTNGTALMTVPS